MCITCDDPLGFGNPINTDEDEGDGFLAHLARMDRVQEWEKMTSRANRDYKKWMKAGAPVKGGCSTKVAVIGFIVGVVLTLVIMNASGFIHWGAK